MVWNYYENVTNDINKRRIRSQWRIKRMKFYNKRVDILNTANEDLRNELEKTDELDVTSSSLIEIPIPFEDENKNYTNTSFQQSYTISTPNITIDQNQDSIQNQYLLANYKQNLHYKKTISNNNEKYKFHNFDELKTLNKETISEISSNKNRTNEQIDEILEQLSTHCIHHSTITERPNLLNVIKLDNAITESQISNIHSNNMTPNNNELDIQQIEFNSTTNEINRKAINFTENINQENSNLETPMSCTTDNFTTSSIQSPISLMYNLEDSSPMEISSIIPSSCTYSITKSTLSVKKDSDLFELNHNEKYNKISPVITPLNITDVEIIDHISLQAYLEKSIRIPLNIQSRLVSNAIIKYFLKENNLLLHLHSLRSYFFLLNGEFAKTLTDSLYTRLYEISVPIELFNSVTLTNLLERALVNSFNNVYINSELLSLSAIDTPTQLEVNIFSYIIYYFFIILYTNCQFVCCNYFIKKN